MGNNGVKGIVFVAILVVLSFLIGSQISGDKTVSFGIVGGCVGLFLLLYLGARAWWMLFLLPVVAGILPMQFPAPLAILLSPFFLVYWALLSLMGYTKFEWKSLWGMDILVLLLFLDTVVTFINHPSSFMMLDEFLGIESQFVGGREYWTCFLGTSTYLCLSLLPLRYADCVKLAKYLFYTKLAVTLYQTGYGILRPGSVATDEIAGDIADRAQNSRFDKLVGLGTLGAAYLYLEYPFLQLIKKPFRLFALILSVGCVAISGWRTFLIRLAVQMSMLAFIKRELTLVICLGSMMYGGLLFLSNEHVLDDLPFGMQRSLCAIPGIHVSKHIEVEARGSSEWRVIMWRWALDARTGYIRNYVWGDGFTQDKADMQRDKTANMRGTLEGGNQRVFAKRGVWHSGWISTMHRIGIVGLVIVVLNQLSTLYYFFRLAFVLSKTDRKTFLYFTSTYIASTAGIPLYHLSAGDLNGYYGGLAFMGTLKLFYCCTRERFAPIINASTKRYIPLMIQETATGPALRSL